MNAWTIWISCVILSVYPQRGQAERIRGNDLQDDYDVDSDVWTERNSITPEAEDPIGKNRTPPDVYTVNSTDPPETDVMNDNNSARSRTDAWIVDNDNGSKTDVPADNNVTRPETGVPTDKLTKSATDVPIDDKVTRPETDFPTVLRTRSDKITASIDERLTGTTTTRFPEILTPYICQNSSCPDILILTTTVPEGGNFTLRCGSTSGTAELWWYRDSTFLQRGVGEVSLDIIEADRSYSGSYTCVDERGCCVLVHHVSVYGVPPYVYHLAVMGAFLAVGLPLCVFLSVRQSSRLGRYARMFSERHGEGKQLIL